MSVRTRWTALVVAAVLLVGGGVAASVALIALADPEASSSTTAPVADPTTTPARATAPAASASVSPTAMPTTTPATASTPEPEPSPTSSPQAPSAAGLVAVTGVVDGDTIKVRVDGRTERIRIIGIDTPELKGDECYARQAASRMQSLVQSKSVRLVRDPTQADRDRYDRLLRHVTLPDGRQVAEILIAGGFGEEYTYDAAYAGQAAYRAAEESAREAGKGIWSSGCRAPSPAVPPPATAECLIKGNIASDGEKIYHVPGQRYYDVTKISESKGERWFCSESDARAAGWRAAKL
ncbi:MAG: thermonuclease family protein [Ornithinibacter sp.]